MFIQYGRELRCGVEEAYTRFAILVGYLAREYEVIEGELMLGTFSYPLHRMETTLTSTKKLHLQYAT